MTMLTSIYYAIPELLHEMAELRKQQLHRIVVCGPGEPLQCSDILPPLDIQGAPKKGHFVLRLVTLEVFIRSAPNLAQINASSFLT